MNNKQISDFTPTELETIKQLLLEPWIYSPKLGFKVFNGVITEVITNLRKKGIVIETKREHTPKANGRRIIRYKIAEVSAVFCGSLVGITIVQKKADSYKLNTWHLSALVCLTNSDHYTFDLLEVDVLDFRKEMTLEEVLSDLLKFGFEIIRTPHKNKLHESIRLHKNSKAKAFRVFEGESLETN